MEDQKILKEDFDDFHIENNEPIGQGEEDFETLFNKVFKKKGVINENNEDYHEMECQLYYLKGISNYIKKEETSQIIQKMNFNHCQKDIISKKEISIDEEEGKDIITINQQKSNSKNTKNLEIDIKENISNEIEINSIAEKKKETNNFITSDLDKQNKFRVYSLNDFNIFHPGGNVEYYKQFREKYNDEINNSIFPYNKSNNSSRKFKILKEKSKRTRRKAKEKKKRKEKPDDIRKKIKSRFLKSIKMRINQMLKIANSKEIFDFLPQSFICNISKQKNKPIINMTFKELLLKNFLEEDKKDNKTFLQKKNKTDKKKYDKNVKVLKYLEKNDEICKKSNFNVIGNMTFRDLFGEYLKSEEFEKEIEKLKEEQNNDNYIKDYIIKAYNFIHYFSSEE
jgi:hypothetical protein